MKNIRSSFVIILTIALLALTAVSVMAAAGDDACAVGEVSGKVVAVEGDTVTLLTDEGVYCSVTVNFNSYDHPIVNLLGMYFGADDLTAEDFDKLIEDFNKLMDEVDGNPTTCAVQDTISGEWQWDADCTNVEPETVIILDIDTDGNVIAMTEDGTLIEFGTSQDYATLISDQIAKVMADLTVDEDGNLSQTIDQIAAYHAQHRREAL